MAAKRGTLEALIERHYESYDSDCGTYFGCGCGWDNDDEYSNDGYAAHLADAIRRHLARKSRAAS